MSGKTTAHLRKKLAAKQEAAEAAPAKAGSDADYDSAEDSDADEYVAPKRPAGFAPKKAGIQWKYVAFLFLLFGTAMLPAVLWVGDKVASLGGGAAKAGGASLSHRLGLAATPKDRLVLFYEKHNSEKVGEVDGLVKKYAGNYAKMVKVLEAKYQDYGFFIGWEKDGDFSTFMINEGAKSLRLAERYYQVYVPFRVRITLFRMYTNVHTVTSPVVTPLYRMARGLLGYDDGPAPGGRRASTSSKRTKAPPRKKPAAPRK
ncbi:hypothetical protein M885DRAFT_468177 [Pelagophyceae sp. CCMP2097]|nr:hypothetical protein M885DRAFT_468177 [Pelagophyceae sp. CCMP2097]|mmetsp:Transcript_9330/g.30845  ORF Transcript_9330/g.30845 Transcript_9330/m.30845 type:complete len:259 (+) Transcript_9330:46-822(+)